MNKLLFLILGFFIPPLAVAMLEGIGFHFWINLALWILGCAIPGIIHAWYLILTRDYEIIRKS